MWKKLLLVAGGIYLTTYLFGRATAYNDLYKNLTYRYSISNIRVNVSEMKLKFDISVIITNLSTASPEIKGFDVILTKKGVVIGHTALTQTNFTIAPKAETHVPTITFEIPFTLTQTFEAGFFLYEVLKDVVPLAFSGQFAAANAKLQTKEAELKKDLVAKVKLDVNGVPVYYNMNA